MPSDPKSGLALPDFSHGARYPARLFLSGPSLTLKFKIYVYKNNKPRCECMRGSWKGWRRCNLHHPPKQQSYSHATEADPRKHDHTSTLPPLLELLGICSNLVCLRDRMRVGSDRSEPPRVSFWGCRFDIRKKTSLRFFYRLATHTVSGHCCFGHTNLCSRII
jgi:hypothetical protein